MIERKVIIVNPSGLHARPAAQVVDFVKTYDGTVELVYGDAVCNLKSILMLLGMGLKQGTEVVLRVAGTDEEAYIAQLAALIESLDE